MLDLDQIAKKLSDRNLNKVARETNLAYDTVWRVAKGRAKQPSYEVVKRLSEYLISKEGA
jgi:transcriptional regulator with XRE-family HTH domain